MPGPGESWVVRALTGAIAAAWLGAVACSGSTYRCAEDSGCISSGVTGRCETNGLCSFPEESCPSGFAYGSLAGTLAGECTDPAADTETTAGAGTTAADAADGDTVGDNSAPVPINDEAVTLVGTPVDIPVLANDSDPDGDALMLTDVSQPVSGTTTIAGDEVHYVPGAGYVGTDAFAYTVEDGHGGSSLGMVVVDVQGTCDAWDPDWSHRIPLTFDNALADGIDPEDLVDFPVLVLLDAALVAQLQLQPDGADLRFVDRDDATPLAYEIERWDPMGTSAIWVRVPQIDADSQRDFIWLYHGNPTAADAQDPAAVWSNGFVAVWHMSEDPVKAAGVLDATTHGHTGSLVNYNDDGITADGKIAGGLDLRTTEHVEVPDDAEFDLTDAITLEAWMRPDVSNMDQGRYAISKSSAYFIHTMRTYTPAAQFFVRLGPPVSDFRATGGNEVLEAGAWSYLVGSFDTQEQVMRFFRDGELRVTRDLAAMGDALAPLEPTDTPVQIGPGHDGVIDEVRVSSVARSAAWVAAQHRAAMGTFVGFGASTETCP